jgi:hypothetical protein
MAHFLQRFDTWVDNFMSIVTRRRRREFAARLAHSYHVIYLFSCAVAAVSSTVVMGNSHDKTKTGINEVESEHPFVAAQEGRRTFTVVTHCSDAHACDH